MGILNRRHFTSLFGLGGMAAIPAVIGAAPDAAAQPKPPGKLPPLKVRIGHQMMGTLSEKQALYLARFGVDGVGAAATIADPERIYATVDELKRTRELAEKHKLTYDIAECELPTLIVDRQKRPAINLGEASAAGRRPAQDTNSTRSSRHACTALRNAAIAS